MNLLTEEKYNVYLIEFDRNKAIKLLGEDLDFTEAGQIAQDKQLLYNPLYYYVAWFDVESEQDIKYRKSLYI